MPDPRPPQTPGPYSRNLQVPSPSDVANCRIGSHQILWPLHSTSALTPPSLPLTLPSPSCCLVSGFHFQLLASASRLRHFRHVRHFWLWGGSDDFQLSGRSDDFRLLYLFIGTASLSPGCFRVSLFLYLKRQLTDYHVEHVIKSSTLHVFVPWLGVAAPESREWSDRNEGCSQWIKPQICV
jgi:hypothetical protein